MDGFLGPCDGHKWDIEEALAAAECLFIQGLALAVG